MTPKIFNFVKLASSLTSFAVAKAVDPNGCLGEIILAITGNLASNYIAKYDPVALMEHFSVSDSESDSEIKKLMIDSVPEAIKRIAEKYLQENEDSDEFIKTTLNSLIKDAKSINHYEADKLKMTTDQNSWLEDVHKCIFEGHKDENGKLEKIEKFFITHLPEFYQLVFIQGLQNENNEKPLKAFLIKSLEGLSKQLTDNAVALTSIMAEIQALKHGKSGKSLSVAKEYLRKELYKINQKLNTLVEGNKLTNEGINDLKQGQKEIQKDLKDLKQNSQLNKPPHHLTPPPFLPEVFLGREEELETIKQKLFTNNHLLLLVNGEGGVGKTSLASKYYHKYQKEYAHMAWVLSEQSIANALLNLAKPLHIAFEDTTPQEERLEILLTAMASLTKPCLLIIDNANELEDLEENYQTLRRCSNFHILLTTRITDFHKAAEHKTGGLPLELALELFKEYYSEHKETENELFRQLYETIGGNTLVIEILAKNLALLNKLKKKYQLSDLLVNLQKEGLLALSQSKEVDTDYHNLKKATPKGIIEAMYDLGGLSPSETALLSVFAVLPADTISFELLEQLLPNTENLEDTLLILVKKGWLDYNKVEAAFKCSPVIQDITQKKNLQLFENCGDLINTLIEKFEYELSTGSLININYEESILYSKYVESIIYNFNRIYHD